MVRLIMIAVLLVGCRAADMDGHRATQMTGEEAGAAWRRLMYQPLELYPSQISILRDFLSDDAEFRDEYIVNASEPSGFDRRVRYGTYTVWTDDPGMYQHALLVGPDGQPLWAGHTVLPLRRDGQVTSLLLLGLLDRVTLSHGSRMYRLIRLDFAQEPHIVENTFGFPHGVVYPPFDPTRMVVDIDGHGGDEFWYLSPTGIKSEYAQIAGIHSGMTQLRWEIWLYTPNEPKPEPNPLFDDSDSDEGESEPRSRNYHLVDVIRVPPTLNALGLSYKTDTGSRTLTFTAPNAEGEDIAFAEVRYDWKIEGFRVRYLLDWPDDRAP